MLNTDFQIKKCKIQRFKNGEIISMVNWAQIDRVGIKKEGMRKKSWNRHKRQQTNFHISE